MVGAGAAEVFNAAAGSPKVIHQGNRCRFIVKRAYVHHLNAQPFICSDKLRGWIVLLIFGSGGVHGSLEISLGYKIGQTDNG